jgi:hypothetical protein
VAAPVARDLQALGPLAPLASPPPTTTRTSSATPSSTSSARPASSLLATPVTPAASSLDQRQAAAAVTFAQPLASAHPAFAPTAAPSAPWTAPSTSLVPAAPLGSLSSDLGWSSPALLGGARLSGPGVLSAEASAAPLASGSGSNQGGPPRTPTAPPCASSAGASGAGGSAASGSSAALAVAAIDCSAPQGLQPHRLTQTLWRQAAFVSLQERPG